jgi:plastocyanin
MVDNNDEERRIDDETEEEHAASRRREDLDDNDLEPTREKPASDRRATGPADDIRGPVGDRRDYQRSYERDRRGGRNWLPWLLGLILLVLLGLLAWLAFGNRNININNQNQQNVNQESEFGSEQKSGNFDQSLPSHSDVFPAAPVGVVIQTNSTSGTNSSVTINKDDKDYGVDSTIVEANGMNLRRMMQTNAPDGVYTVNYKSCSGSNCQNGSYQFKVDSSQKSDYQDLTNQRSVNISLNNNKFNPDKITIAKGTKVTWANNNNSEVTIGPGIKDIQNFLTTFSTGKLAAGATVSFTFNQSGYYPIIVFSNGQMIVGNIIVQ